MQGHKECVRNLLQHGASSVRLMPHFSKFFPPPSCSTIRLFARDAAAYRPSSTTAASLPSQSPSTTKLPQCAQIFAFDHTCIWKTSSTHNFLPGCPVAGAASKAAPAQHNRTRAAQRGRISSIMYFHHTYHVVCELLNTKRPLQHPHCVCT